MTPVNTDSVTRTIVVRVTTTCLLIERLKLNLLRIKSAALQSSDLCLKYKFAVRSSLSISCFETLTDCTGSLIRTKSSLTGGIGD